MNGHLTCRPTTRVRQAPNFFVAGAYSSRLALTFTDVFVPDTAILGTVGHGLAIAQTFVHENRLRQAASSLGAAEYCIEESIKYARRRKPFGKELSANQGIQFPIVELATQVSRCLDLIPSIQDRAHSSRASRKLACVFVYRAPQPLRPSSITRITITNTEC